MTFVEPKQILFLINHIDAFSPVFTIIYYSQCIKSYITIWWPPLLFFFFLPSDPLIVVQKETQSEIWGLSSCRSYSHSYSAVLLFIGNSSSGNNKNNNNNQYQLLNNKSVIFIYTMSYQNICILFFNFYLLKPIFHSRILFVFVFARVENQLTFVQ